MPRVRIQPASVGSASFAIRGVPIVSGWPAIADADRPFPAADLRVTPGWPGRRTCTSATHSVRIVDAVNQHDRVWRVSFAEISRNLLHRLSRNRRSFPDRAHNPAANPMPALRHRRCRAPCFRCNRSMSPCPWLVCAEEIHDRPPAKKPAAARLTKGREILQVFVVGRQRPSRRRCVGRGQENAIASAAIPAPQ